MATHSSVLAWRIPGTAEPGGLPFMGSHRVGHNWSDLAAAAVADSILKSRDITLPTMDCLVKAMVFPVVMYGCERWTIKKAECQRIDAFEMWCWRRLLRIPWTARRSNQSILKEISPDYSLEGLMLKLKLQYFGYLMRRTDSFEKTDAGKDWRQEEKETTEDESVGWHHQLNGPEFDSNSWWWTRRPGVLWFMGLQRVGHDWVTELNWIE